MTDINANTSVNTEPTAIFLNVDAIVRSLPMSKSTWLAGVKSGKFPKPIRLTPARPVWRKTDIDALVASIV
jgi:prophage regulatory protein